MNILLSLFADDTDIFLEASFECLEAVIAELIEFGVHSGCRRNVKCRKTKCIPLGKAKSNAELISKICANKYGPEFIQNTFTALGITFSNQKSVAYIMKVTYEAKITKT